MDEYKKIDYLLSGLLAHAVNKKKLTDAPYQEGTVIVFANEVWTMEDGVEIEICYWTDVEYRLTLWDFIVDREAFDNSGKGGIEEYLAKIGVPLENVKDENGKWEFTGLEKDESQYLVQFSQKEI